MWMLAGYIKEEIAINLSSYEEQVYKNQIAWNLVFIILLILDAGGER